MFDFSTMPSWLGGTPAPTQPPAQPGWAGQQMEGGWQMPQMTGGAKAGYAAPGATGAMDPGAPGAGMNYAGLASGLLGFANQLAAKHQAQQPPPMQPMQMMQQPHYTPGVNPYGGPQQQQPFGGPPRPFWGG